MNETLSTLIAFVGVLVVFSMLVQSLQEALKSFFTMKAGVWWEFWRSVYREELGLGDSANRKPGAATDRPAGIGGPFKRLVGWVASLLTAPWRGLKWTYRARKREPVEDLDVRMKCFKENLANAVVVLGEARAALTQLKPPQGVPQVDAKVLKQKAESTRKAVEALKLHKILEIYRSVDTSTTLTDLEEALKKTFSNAMEPENIEPALDSLLSAITTTENNVLAVKSRLENRFDVWMAKVETTYRKHMLFITVLIGAILVLVSNADAFSIYRSLSASPQARDAVVARVEEVAKQALTSKAEDLNAIYAFIQAADFAKAQSQARALCANLAHDFETYKAGEMKQRATVLKDAIDKLQPGEEGVKALTKNQAELTSLLVSLNRTAVETHAHDIAGLELPLGWSRQDLDAWRSAVGGAAAILVFKKLGGLLITIFLITFGAPFWNDVLGALVGVKTTLGKKAKA
jgi:hypothetical protein